jgi:D-threonate/D-erythronate kinase
VYPSGRVPVLLPASFAIDAGTRDAAPGEAALLSLQYARQLEPHPSAVAFKKVDSLLRGNPGLELAQVLKALEPARCVVAPAFPFHGRVTRGGVQFARSDGSWTRVGEDLAATLLSEGIPVRKRMPGDPVPDGVSLWDAETDNDLGAIAAAAQDGPVLWCGSGGLARALAGLPVPVPEPLARPILGLFGSDHPVTGAQLSRCGETIVPIEQGGAGMIADRLAERGICLARFALPPGTSRPAAAQRISRALSGLALRLPAPGSLFVSGGETLGALCAALRTERLDLIGQFLPGVPVSVLVGGRWAGVRVASKSGAFGEEGLLREVLGLGAPP